MNTSFSLSTILGGYAKRSGYTTGQLARRAGIPKRTLANWIAGAVEKPRHPGDLLKLAIAMRLNRSEADHLLRAAGGPTIEDLRRESESETSDELAGLLAAWDAASSAFNLDIGDTAYGGQEGHAMQRARHLVLVQGILAAAPQLEVVGPYPVVEELLTSAELAARDLDDRASLVKLLRVKGRVERRRARMAQAHALFEEALHIARADNDDLAVAGILGEFVVSTGLMDIDYEASIRYSDQALAIAQRYEDPGLIAWLLKNRGTVALRLNDHTTAATCFREALDLARDMGDTALIIRLLNNLGILSGGAQDPDGALPYWNEALDLARESGNLELISALLFNIGVVYCNRGDVDQGEHLLEESLEIARHMGQQIMIRRNLNALASYYDERNEAARAETYRQELAILEAHHSPA